MKESCDNFFLLQKKDTCFFRFVHFVRLIVIVRVTQLVDVDIEDRNAFLSIDLLCVVVAKQTVFKRAILAAETAAEAVAIAQIEINQCTDDH